jgi:hypothetical protein
VVSVMLVSGWINSWSQVPLCVWPATCFPAMEMRPGWVCLWNGSGGAWTQRFVVCNGFEGERKAKLFQPDTVRMFWCVAVLGRPLYIFAD